MPKYYMPTTLLSGNNCIKRHPHHIIRGEYALIVTGRHSAVVSGALNDVTEVLKSNKIKYEIYDKVSDKTTISDIYKLGTLMKEKGMDYLIGIGGGSTLDVAKAVSVYAANDIEPMEIYQKQYEKDPFPVVCVPTTAGTGSDTTQYVMITLDNGEKKSYCAEQCFPYSTFLDSRYTRTMPPEVSRNTAVDALCHAVESFLNSKASPFSDVMALDAIRLIGKSSKALISGEFTDSDRENLLIAASEGGMALAYTGLNVVHAMGYQLTTQNGIPHGRANGTLLPDFLFWAAKQEPMRAVKVIDTFGTDLTSFKKIINKIIPTSETFTSKDVEKWVRKSIVSTVSYNSIREMTSADEIEIYTNALVKKRSNYLEW